MKTLLILILALISLVTAWTTALSEPALTVGGIRMDDEANVPGVPGDVNDELEETVADSETANGEFIIAPLPIRNPLLGWVLGLPAMYIYQPANHHPDDGVWVTGAFGFYAENESSGLGAFHRMSIGGDKWRLMAAAFQSDVKYNFFGIGGDGRGPAIPLSQPMDLVVGEVLRRVTPNLFLGLKGTYSETEISLNIPTDSLSPSLDLDKLVVDLTLATLTPRLRFDSRDSDFYPTSGFLVDADIAITRTAFGADLDYEKFSLSANHYYPLSKSGVIASRVSTQYASSDTPFFMYPAFGMGADLRGYQTGTYRDQYLIAMQSEYRHRFSQRIGGVVFLGVGAVSSELGDWGTSLPSAGVGFRYVLAQQNNVGLRFDVAKGRDDTTWYVGVGEAF